MGKITKEIQLYGLTVEVGIGVELLEEITRMGGGVAYC